MPYSMIIPLGDLDDLVKAIRIDHFLGVFSIYKYQLYDFNIALSGACFFTSILIVMAMYILNISYEGFFGFKMGYFIVIYGIAFVGSIFWRGYKYVLWGNAIEYVEKKSFLASLGAPIIKGNSSNILKEMILKSQNKTITLPDDIPSYHIALYELNQIATSKS